MFLAFFFFKKIYLKFYGFEVDKKKWYNFLISIVKEKFIGIEVLLNIREEKIGLKRR